MISDAIKNELGREVTPNDAIDEIASATNTRVWSSETQGRQGDVLIERLPEPPPEAARLAYSRRVDTVLAKGSRAAHVVIGEVSCWESPTEPDVIYAEAYGRVALVHTDQVAHRHHPHVLPAGWYRCRQQAEATPTGVVRD